jgi:rare lipoprotein A
VTLVTGCATHLVADEDDDHAMEGIASWYGGEFQGRPTASGEIFDTNLFTAAHRTLPFGTVVLVTRMDTGAQVEVRINDRGPFVEDRIIDLSRAAAEALSMTGAGVAPVRLTIVHGPPDETRSIQVISVSTRDAAEQVQQRTQEAGIGSIIEPTNTGLYRVVVPDVADTDVDRIVAALAGIGYTSVLVRSR